MKAFNEAYNPQTFQKKICRKIKKIEILKKKSFFWSFFEFQKNQLFEVANFKIFAKMKKKTFFVTFKEFTKKNYV